MIDDDAAPAASDTTDALRTVVQEAAQDGSFSGVVSIARGEDVLLEACYGYAHRGLGVVPTPSTRFATASGSKTFTALAVMRLIEDGVLTLDTLVRRYLGADLPLIDDGVTVHHLLGHTSGIGDYLDESSDVSFNDHLMVRPVHEYTDAESFLPDLEGHEQVSPPGEQYAYNNGAYLVLALVAARASGRDYHELVRTEVLARAGMEQTDFLRSDRLPGDAALGYLEDSGDYSNILHLPVLGGGDGGAYTNAADMRRFWRALDEGRIVSRDSYELMTTTPHLDEEEGLRVGLGFYRHEHGGNAVLIEGCDAGVSFRSTHDADSGLTVTVLGNTMEGAWPVIEALLPLFPAR